MAIRDEQAAFEAQLDVLMAGPANGKFVLVFGGAIEGTFDTHSAAYTAGLERHGSGAEFLVARVEKQAPVSVKIAWDLGLARVQ